MLHACEEHTSFFLQGLCLKTVPVPPLITTARRLLIVTWDLTIGFSGDNYLIAPPAFGAVQRVVGGRKRIFL